MVKLPIETDRLLLRQYRDDDLEDILAYSSDADYWLARNIDWTVTEEGAQEHWETQRSVDLNVDPQWLSLLVELKEEGKVIGHVGIGVTGTGDNRQGRIGWLIGRRHQGRGLATEAARALITAGFEQLKLHRISARTGRDNVRSWYLMERLGMRREAHFVRSHRVRGRWRDEFTYAVLADEWDAIQQRLQRDADLVRRAGRSRE